jgi:putative two-component system response regulator
LAAEFRDDATGQHTKRVGVLSSQIASALGWSDRRAMLLGQAAQLHDIGKIGVSDRILLKPGPLTAEEFAAMKKHTEIGASILIDSSSPVLAIAEQVVRYHHERWDGAGYFGLAGEEIPLAARIVCVADCFDAISSDRPYRASRPREVAIEEIRNHSGTQFDPTVVGAFLKVMEQSTF